jgi:hypothetical protein
MTIKRIGLSIVYSVKWLLIVPKVWICMCTAGAGIAQSV